MENLASEILFLSFVFIHRMIQGNVENRDILCYNTHSYVSGEGTETKNYKFRGNYI